MSKYYMARLFDFLRRLDANNNREWFRENKAEYDELRDLWLQDLDRFILLVGEEEPAYRRLTGKQAAFRIYRDTRFSPDKRPLKPYFSASVTDRGRNAHRAGIYLHFQPDNDETGVFGGIWCPEATELKKLRRAIVDNIEEWEEIVADPAISDFEIWTSGELKTVPKGWEKNHPQARWLRMKDYGLWGKMEQREMTSPDWVEIAAEKAVKTLPFIRFLNYSLDESLE